MEGTENNWLLTTILNVPTGILLYFSVTKESLHDTILYWVLTFQDAQPQCRGILTLGLELLVQLQRELMNKTNDQFGFRCHSIIAYLDVKSICLFKWAETHRRIQCKWSIVWKMTKVNPHLRHKTGFLGPINLPSYIWVCKFGYSWKFLHRTIYWNVLLPFGTYCHLLELIFTYWNLLEYTGSYQGIYWNEPIGI